jgi:hypothetical protein
MPGKVILILILPLLLATAIVLAQASTPALTVQARATPEPTQTPPPTRTPAPTLTATPVPTPVPSELVWFAPNMGSVDYIELFNKPESWSGARQRIDVFQFYDHLLLFETNDEPCDICGENYIKALLDVGAFEKLANWGIAIAIEAGGGCNPAGYFGQVSLLIGNVQANGGTVSFVAMDVPIAPGQCGYEAIGRPQHIIFQSWQGPAPSGHHEVPINLPENDPMSTAIPASS